jgi:hypothetical protein
MFPQTMFAHMLTFILTRTLSRSQFDEAIAVMYMMVTVVTNVGLEARTQRSLLHSLALQLERITLRIDEEKTVNDFDGKVSSEFFVECEFVEMCRKISNAAYALCDLMSYDRVDKFEADFARVSTFLCSALRSTHHYGIEQ